MPKRSRKNSRRKYRDPGDALYVRDLRNSAKKHRKKRPKRDDEIAQRRRLRKIEAENPLGIWPFLPGIVDGERKVAMIEMPAVFSFIENPTESLRALYRLRAAIRDPKIDHVYLNHATCENLDLCASVVTDVLVLRGRKDRMIRGLKLGVGGSYSSAPEVNVLLKANGILKQIGHPDAALPEELVKRIVVGDLMVGQASSPEGTTEGELAATRLTRFFDKCLNAEEYELELQWKSNLIALITEVLDNCEQHARRDSHWYTIGYFNRLPDQEAGGECHIVLFNFGDSIYESLKRRDTPQSLKTRITELSDVHRTSGFFGLFGEKGWDEESLWTVYALQEGVSRFSDTPGGEDRGNGTIRLIEFFTELAGEKPKMALVSGHTYILFDGTHSLRTAMVDGDERKVIAFNADNDLKKPPDSKYVQYLPLKFPGTVVSLRFLLHRQFLKDRKAVRHALCEN